MTPTTISAAIIMVAVAAALLLWFREDLASGSARRMAGMMTRVGLDPKVLGDTQATRSRCRKCPSEDLCERWLAGEVRGGNAFCPNAETFRILVAPGAVPA